MTKLFRRKSKKVGAPPGSLIYTGEKSAQASFITLILFNEEECIEKKLLSIEELDKMPNLSKYKLWLHVQSVQDPKIIEAVGKYFKLHPLLLEDVMSPTQRSKLEDYKDYLFIVLRILHWIPSGTSSLEDCQLSLVVGKNFLISFSESEEEIIQIVRDRLKKPGSRMRSRNADYIAYALIDTLTDSNFVILEKFDTALEGLENELFTSPSPNTMSKIQRSKREIVLLRKVAWPIRELVNQFRRIESPLITEATRLYSLDLYDHTIQMIETIESFRDVSSSLVDIYLSSINQKMNEVMKLLTIVSTIFVPLTFITSLYGMNFVFMPELGSPWGYPVVLFTMLIIALWMLWMFRKKQWI